MISCSLSILRSNKKKPPILIMLRSDSILLMEVEALRSHSGACSRVTPEHDVDGLFFVAPEYLQTCRPADLQILRSKKNKTHPHDAPESL